MCVYLLIQEEEKIAIMGTKRPQEKESEGDRAAPCAKRLSLVSEGAPATLWNMSPANTSAEKDKASVSLAKSDSLVNINGISRRDAQECLSTPFSH